MPIMVLVPIKLRITSVILLFAIIVAVLDLLRVKAICFHLDSLRDEIKSCGKFAIFTFLKIS